MINIQNKLFVLFFISLMFPYPGFSQTGLTNEPRYEVNRIYPPISISKEKLISAHTLIDLNDNYKSSWVREYISVEILTSYKGSIKKAMSNNDTLSQEQKEMMKRADSGEDIVVNVKYIPENILTNNDIKEIRFTLKVDPETEANYPGGQQKLRQYLKENAIDKIPDGSFKKLDLAAVKFTIDEKGQIIDAQVFETSENKRIDELLLETICNMPKWNPAEYANGTRVKQDFVLTVGDMENCMINLLNIRQN